ncbi:MAG: deoxyribose-phosphate aldolase [Candidatus Kapabacteria bacterium]|nr:deoxyribose-phosphate aldolase [Candidatus Kapabacteria bacterium]
MELNVVDVASRIEHTILKPDTNYLEVEKLCKEVQDFNFACVCVLPYFVGYSRSILVKREKVCTVIGFPLGASFVFSKMDECVHALKNGAGEIDMVINIAALLAHDYRTVATEISSVADIAHNTLAKVKVIVETCLLNEQQKIDVCKIVSDNGADYIKTSTGFSHGGATLHDIELLRKYSKDELKIKASGGIKTAQFAIELINAGADRIGTSSGVKIIQELNSMNA